jgi:hypothetical protein
MGSGKKAKNKAKAVKGKAKKNAGKVARKGRKAKSPAKHWPAWRRPVAGRLKDLLLGREHERTTARPKCITTPLLATIQPVTQGV